MLVVFGDVVVVPVVFAEVVVLVLQVAEIATVVVFAVGLIDVMLVAAEVVVEIVTVVVVNPVYYFEDMHRVFPGQSMVRNRYMTKELHQTHNELGSTPEHSTVVNRLKSGLKHQGNVDRFNLNIRRWWYKKTLIPLDTPPAAPQLTAAEPTSVDEGQSVTLRCTLSTLGNPHITWSWVCGYDTLTTGVTNTGIQSVLILTANRKYNQRTCQCRATSPRPSLSYDRTSATQTITVYYNNVITSHMSAEYVTSEHGRLKIKCDMDGNPLSTITWLFVPNNTVVKRDSSVNSSSLDITSSNCQDHGDYSVTAVNGKGPAAVRTIHVTVRCKPRLHYIDSQTPDNIVIGYCDSLKILVKILLYPPSNLTQWTFIGKNNLSRVIQNNTDGYRIADARGENEQNITLHKIRINTEDFGNYIIMVQNDVGTFYGSYQVDTATPPVIPSNVTLDCGNPSSITISWISNFNGGDSQTFKISYSTVGNSTYKDLDTISDKGYGRRHSYTPSIDLRRRVWFTVTASNMFGKSRSDALYCTVAKFPELQESVGNQTGAAVGSVVGIVALIIIILVLVIFLRRRYTFIIIGSDHWNANFRRKNRVL
ncbi:hemicentin-1-like [Ostrea edulis]|uniref:hemicentin-1-like n=1 Tax=Ostrea edulis TaxID=37623 RepID=UPI0024AF8F86|nr:hemicentin-1-like [Ostrea edulis]